MNLSIPMLSYDENGNPIEPIAPRISSLYIPEYIIDRLLGTPQTQHTTLHDPAVTEHLRTVAAKHDDDGVRLVAATLVAMIERTRDE